MRIQLWKPLLAVAKSIAVPAIKLDVNRPLARICNNQLAKCNHMLVVRDIHASALVKRKSKKPCHCPKPEEKPTCGRARKLNRHHGKYTCDFECCNRRNPCCYKDCMCYGGTYNNDDPLPYRGCRKRKHVKKSRAPKSIRNPKEDHYRKQ